MAKARGDGGSDSFWSRRMLEWAIVGCLVLVVVLALVRQTHIVKGQAELAAVRSVLAGLRTALVLEHLKRAVAVGEVISPEVSSNPFELLQNRMPNYLGGLTAQQVERLPPGHWLFDRDCACLAYRALDSAWLANPDGSDLAWFTVSPPPGARQITARAAYRWREQALE